MAVYRNWQYHLGAIVVLIAFVAFKWHFLGLPLYWDEAWVYGPAVKAMHTNGLSILPNTIGTELSRGHPLLFHFMAALWATLFGASNTSLHTFSLLLATILLFLVYWIGSKLGSRQIGLAALLLVSLNETFLAQSSILLPEIAMGLSLLLAVWAYMSENVAGYIVAATCALFIKESAIVLVLALICWQAISVFISKPTNQSRSGWRWFVVIPTPLVPAFLFLLYQRLTYGWFFYPLHIGMISWDIRDIHYLFKFGYRVLFEQQGMEWATLAFGLLAPLLWKGWHKRYMGAIVAVIYVAAIKVLDGKWTLAPLPTLIVTLACFGAILFLQFIPLMRKEGPRGEFPAITLILVLGFLMFSALNFFSDRYLTGLIPFVALGMSAVLYSALAPWHKALFPAVILIIATNLFWHIGRDGHVGDTRISYADDIRAHQWLISECERMELQDATIYGSFMEITYMTDANSGYLKTDRAFEHVSSDLKSQTEFAIVNQGSPSELKSQLISLGFTERRLFRSGPAWCALYQKNTEPAISDHE
ncbi:MAG: glycosyltransferase family 39 protein [Flavobacteriales bacterium]|nr:glycosyltransferase family 39 protein [Flavobacteriales bacterium]